MKKNSWDKQNKKDVGLKTMSIIILYASIKRQSKQDPTIYFLKNWNIKITNRLKVNGCTGNTWKH